MLWLVCANHMVSGWSTPLVDLAPKMLDELTLCTLSTLLMYCSKHVRSVAKQQIEVATVENCNEWNHLLWKGESRSYKRQEPIQDSQKVEEAGIAIRIQSYNLQLQICLLRLIMDQQLVIVQTQTARLEDHVMLTPVLAEFIDKGCPCHTFGGC